MRRIIWKESSGKAWEIPEGIYATKDVKILKGISFGCCKSSWKNSIEHSLWISGVSIEKITKLFIEEYVKEFLQNLWKSHVYIFYSSMICKDCSTNCWRNFILISQEMFPSLPVKFFEPLAVKPKQIVWKRK